MKIFLRMISILMLVATLFIGGCNSNTEQNDNTEGTTETEQMITELSTQTNSDEITNLPAIEERFAPIREKAKTQGIKVLFIGNSLTYYNDMPRIFQMLSLMGGKKVTVDSVTKGATGIGDWRADSTLWNERVEKIRSKDWDIVVIQPNRHGSVMTEELPWYASWELSAAKELVEIIRENGSEPVIYSSFGVNNGVATSENVTKAVTRKEHTDLITAYCAAVAKELDCMSVYVCSTFNKVYEERNDLNLYHTDERHPSAMGSYLVACDFYTMIFGESAENVNYNGSLNAETAKYLRKTAATLLGFTPEKIAVIEEIEKP